MRKTKLPIKAVLHIPQQAFVNGKLTNIDCAGAIERLLAALADAGVTSLYSTQATGYYNGRSYPELLFTVFGGPEIMSAVVAIFEDWNISNRDTLRQEAFAYELNGEMIVYQY